MQQPTSKASVYYRPRYRFITTVLAVGTDVSLKPCSHSQHMNWTEQVDPVTKSISVIVRTDGYRHGSETRSLSSQHVYSDATVHARARELHDSSVQFTCCERGLRVNATGVRKCRAEDRLVTSRTWLSRHRIHSKIDIQQTRLHTHSCNRLCRCHQYWIPTYICHWCNIM